MSENQAKTELLAASSVREYRSRCNKIVRDFERSLHSNEPDAFTAVGLARWLLDEKPRWARAKWGKNRAAFVWAISTDDYTPWACLSDEDKDEAFAVLDESWNCDVTLGRGMLTSATKRKAISYCDLQRIRDFLETDSRSRHRHHIAQLLEATVLTGLRPSEWPGSSITQDDENGFVLKVRNGKHSFGRAHGETRTLTFGADFPEAERDALRLWIKAIDWYGANDEVAYNKFYNVLRVQLNRTVRRLWPRRRRHICFYSGRHEAAARFKLFYSLAEVACLLGHVSDATSTSHYARAPKGKRAVELGDIAYLVPMPSPCEVQRIKSVFWERRVSCSAVERSLSRTPAM